MARSMRPERRAAKAAERAEDQAVRAYLRALHARDHRVTRSTASVREQLQVVRSQLRGAPPVEELLLLQRHRELESELRSIDQPTDIDDLEAEFVAVAASYGDAKGITYGTWLDLGVDATVLEAAGIPPADV